MQLPQPHSATSAPDAPLQAAPRAGPSNNDDNAELLRKVCRQGIRGSSTEERGPLQRLLLLAKHQHLTPPVGTGPTDKCRYRPIAPWHPGEVSTDERLLGLSRVERCAWGRAVITAQKREAPSRYWRERSRYGALGAAHLLIARQLLFLGGLATIGIFVVVAVAGRNGDPAIGQWSLVSAAVVLAGNAGRHGAKASRLGRQFRKAQEHHLKR